MFCFLVNRVPPLAKPPFLRTESECTTPSRTRVWRLHTQRNRVSLFPKIRCALDDTTPKQNRPLLISRRSILQLLAAGLALPVVDASARVVIADPNAGSRVVSTPSGLKYYDFVTSVKDNAATASIGDKVTIEYTLGSTGARNGWLIEASTQHPPLTFKLGTTDDDIVSGLHEGVVGMRVSSRRRLLIPAKLGYLRPTDQPIPKGFAEYQRFKNIYLNPDRPYKPDVVIDVTLLRVD